MKVDIGNVVAFLNKYPEYLNNILVETRYGYKKIEAAAITLPNSKWLNIKTKSTKISCSHDHLLLVTNNKTEFVKSNDLIIGDYLHTKFGLERILSISESKRKEDLVDIQVDGIHEFYANNIVSHNSVIQEVISFVLYGVPYRKINKTALVNSINGKNCETWCEFESNNKNYRVERTIKPDSLKIYEDGLLIPQLSTVKEYQELFERTILKFDYSAFCQMNIIGSMGYTPFLQLKANERRAFIESILDLQLFTTMNKLLKTVIAEEKTKYSTSTTNITVINNNINTYNNIIKQLEAGNDTKKLALDSQLKEKVKEYREAISPLEQLKLKLDAITIPDGNEDGVDIKTLLIESKSKVSIAQSNNASLANKIKFFDTTPECKTCGQVIDSTHKEKHLAEYESDIENNNLIIETHNENIYQYQLILDNITKQQQEKSALESKINTINSNAEYLKSDGIRLKKERLALDTPEDNTTLVNTKAQLETSKISLLTEQEINNQLFTNLQAYDIMLSALKDNGAKAEIVKKYIPVINSTVNHYLDKLGLFVNFELDENFNETLKSRQRDSFTYDSFSMGERMRIDIALLFTWREIIKYRTGVDTNLIFFDEVLEILDQEGFEQLLSIVDITPKLNCFIITHKENLEVMFDEVIVVTKEKGFTTILTEDATQ